MNLQPNEFLSCLSCLTQEKIRSVQRDGEGLHVRLGKMTFWCNICTFFSKQQMHSKNVGEFSKWKKSRIPLRSSQSKTIWPNKMKILLQ